MDGPLRIDLKTILGRLDPDAFGHLAQTQRTIKPEPHVFSDREGVKETEMLKHHGNPEGAGLLRVAHVHRFAIEQHGAIVGFDGAIDDFHERGLARPVFSEHGMDAARCNR